MGTKLSDVLATVQGQCPADDTLKGAIVFLALDRTLDHLIQSALSLDEYHRGLPSPWSHVILLADKYTGGATPTVECTVRDKKNRIIWDQDHANLINILSGHNVKSGICRSRLDDYDDARVLRAGVKWLPDLTSAQRSALVNDALDRKWRPYRYDFPGLLREVIRIATGNVVTIPAGHNLLFCSAFIQRVYTSVLGPSGRFVPDIHDEDASPDDLWYPNRGTAVGPTETRGRPMALALKTVGPVRRAATTDVGMEARAAVRGHIDDALGVLAQKSVMRSLRAVSTSRGAATVDPAEVETFLRDARRNLPKARAYRHERGIFFDTDNLALSLVLSRLDEIRGRQPRGGMTLKEDVPGLGKYELLDPGWILSVINWLTHKRVTMKPPTTASDFRVECPQASVRLALVGDWGTGLPTSAHIAEQIRAQRPDITIHLGDVYYSGTLDEVRQNFLASWPSGGWGSFALNSNHEMYAGGDGYLHGTLVAAPFSAHQQTDLFCIVLPQWQVIGLDSAYDATGLYEKGRLGTAQLHWLQQQLLSGAQSGRKSILLTHHNPLSGDGTRDEKFLDQITRAAKGSGPFSYWYWAHQHAPIRFAPFTHDTITFAGRCVGHGGIPYQPEKMGKKKNGVQVDWTETELAKDPNEPRRALNGFLLLELTNQGVTETFIDEFGRTRDGGPGRGLKSTSRAVGQQRRRTSPPRRRRTQ